ncbi:MAG: GNAT family N-acetyltransferase [Methanomicrobiales archaeon]|nr:GNAT family N-acetyltransferase [Methanomicrobiales archaeon]
MTPFTRLKSRHFDSLMFRLRYLAYPLGIRDVQVFRYEAVPGEMATLPDYGDLSIAVYSKDDAPASLCGDTMVGGSGTAFVSRLIPWIYRKRTKKWCREIQQWLAEGEVCVVAYRKEQAVGYIWITLTGNRYDSDLEEIQVLKDREAELHTMRIVPELRGHAIGRRLFAATCSYLADRHYSRVSCFVDIANVPSNRMVSGQGFRAVKVISYTRIGWWKRRREHILPVTETPGKTHARTP